MVTLEEMRSVVQRVDFPASKEDILRQLQAQGTPPAVLDRLRDLPEHYYGSSDTVMDALRGME